VMVLAEVTWNGGSPTAPRDTRFPATGNRSLKSSSKAGCKFLERHEGLWREGPALYSLERGEGVLHQAETAL